MERCGHDLKDGEMGMGSSTRRTPCLSKAPQMGTSDSAKEYKLGRTFVLSIFAMSKTCLEVIHQSALRLVWAVASSGPIPGQAHCIEGPGRRLLVSATTTTLQSTVLLRESMLSPGWLIGCPSP